MSFKATKAKQKGENTNLPDSKKQGQSKQKLRSIRFIIPAFIVHFIMYNYFTGPYISSYKVIFVILNIANNFWLLACFLSLLGDMFLSFRSQDVIKTKTFLKLADKLNWILFILILAQVIFLIAKYKDR